MGCCASHLANIHYLHFNKRGGETTGCTKTDSMTLFQVRCHLYVPGPLLLYCIIFPSFSNPSAVITTQSNLKNVRSSQQQTSRRHPRCSEWLFQSSCYILSVPFSQALFCFQCHDIQFVVLLFSVFGSLVFMRFDITKKQQQLK